MAQHRNMNDGRTMAGKELVLARELSRIIPDDPVARRAAARGELIRLRRGVYVDMAYWRTLSPDQRYRTVCRGYALARDGSPVLSHHSAAAMHGLPMVGSWPSEIHVVTNRSSGGRSKASVVTHAVGIDSHDVVMVDGVLITGIERTVIDMSATLPDHAAVAMVDAAIHVDRFRAVEPMTTRAALIDTWQRLLPFRGSVRSDSLVRFADERAGSVAESTSRVTMALIGAPAPILQQQFSIDGRIVETDFFWRDCGTIGEADGYGKYLRPELRAGRTVEQVVVDEKVREDALRRQVDHFTRWDYAIGLSRDRLRARLAEASVPLGRPQPLSQAIRRGFGASPPE